MSRNSFKRHLNTRRWHFVTLTRHGRGVFKGWKTTGCPDHPPDHWPTTSREGLHTCGNRPGSSPALTCRWQLLPLPCHWVSVTPLVVPICCTNSPAYLIWSFRPWAVWGFQWFHLWGLSPEEMACGTAAISAPIIHLCVLLCWPVPARSAPLWVYRAKKLCVLPASLAPLMCHGQARVLLLSFSLILSLPSPPPPLSCAPTGVYSLYWMVQKQNHKPISVTLSMRLDGPNLSPSGAIGSTPVSLKRPLSSRLRELFV